MRDKYGSVMTGEGPRSYKIIGEIVRLQSNAPDKALALHRFVWSDTGEEELRSGWYYRQDDRWRWARSPQMIPMDDFVEMIRAARDAGWFKL